MHAHELKTWPQYFSRVFNGQKRFEVRKNDRDFQVGDIVTLAEYDPDKKEYTGRRSTHTIIYILHGGNFGIEAGTVVMSLTDAE